MFSLSLLPQTAGSRLLSFCVCFYSGNYPPGFQPSRLKLVGFLGLWCCESSSFWLSQASVFRSRSWDCLTSDRVSLWGVQRSFCSTDKHQGEPGMLNTRGCLFKWINVDSLFPPRRRGVGVVNSLAPLYFLCGWDQSKSSLRPLSSACQFIRMHPYGRCHMSICRTHLYETAHIFILRTFDGIILYMGSSQSSPETFSPRSALFFYSSSRGSDSWSLNQLMSYTEQRELLSSLW